MSKSNKPSSESSNVADKLRDSLSIEENKPDFVNVDHGSPNTPLLARSSGLTSAATTTTTTSSCSSSSSGSVTGRGSATRKPDSVPAIPSAAQSKSSGASASQSPKPTASSAASQSRSAVETSKSTPPSTSQSKSTAPSTGKSSKATNISAAQSKAGSSAAAQSKEGSSAASQSKAGSSAAPKSGSSSGKTGSSSKPGNLGSGRGSATSDSASGTAKQSGKSTTAPVKIPPGGNLFPSGNVRITGMTQGEPRSHVLGQGAKYYGYGNIMRGAPAPTSSSRRSNVGPDADTLWKTVLKSTNPEEVKRIGNEMYKNGCLNEALKCYDRAIALSPAIAAYHSNRGAALSGLKRIGEAVNACDRAVKLDPKFTRAHHRLATLLMRLGQVEGSGTHFYAVEDPPDEKLVRMLQVVDKHLNKCTEARRRGEWEIALTEVSSAMASGADCSPHLSMCKVEALLKLQRIEDAQTVLAFLPKIEPFPASFSQTPFFGISGEAYMSFVYSQLDLTLGRFENAVTAAEKALEMDPENSEVTAWYKKVKLIDRARDRGNDLCESERYTEASLAYGEGLKFDPRNATLLCHRGDCFFKIRKWESAIEDYNQSLIILPSYMKPRMQRAASYGKLEKWEEAVRDYETLKLGMPYDKELAESLFHAQVALKKSRGEVVINMEFGAEVEEISSVKELEAALTRSGTSIVYFFKASDEQCREMCVFVDSLCVRYRSMHFLKVEIEKYPQVGEAERVRVVPTVAIYKMGTRIKEIVCPTKEVLENSVRQYGRQQAH